MLFFMKQKTAYEDSAGLVGSEMCMRDRYLRVLPMGWSWALHLCQRVMESIVESVVGPSRILRDRDDSLTIGPAPAHVANLNPNLSENVLPLIHI